jgi:hypothetical protein
MASGSDICIGVVAGMDTPGMLVVVAAACALVCISWFTDSNGVIAACGCAARTSLNCRVGHTSLANVSPLQSHRALQQTFVPLR